MCEQLTPIEALRNLKWSVSALAHIACKSQPGSYEQEVARLAARGINTDIDWVIARLESKGETAE
jgi:hypothetical protein